MSHGSVEKIGANTSLPVEPVVSPGVYMHPRNAVSGSAEVLLGRVRRLELWLLGAVVAGVILVYLIHRLTKRELHKLL